MPCHATMMSASCFLDKLMKKIGVKDEAVVVDLSGSRVVVESLTETKIMCTAATKVGGGSKVAVHCISPHNYTM